MADGTNKTSGSAAGWLPAAHFHAFAPPEVWWRLLAEVRFRVGPRYWLRLALAFVGMATSFVLTLPERLLLAPIIWWKFRRPECIAFDHPPGVVIVLGYFRSGTTHLHNLLSCDARYVTPRWRHCIAPQGFWVSWTVLRALLIPFLPNSRPQDDVPFGPDWPAEDDFATANWTLSSSIPGRFVLPTTGRARFARFHTLRGLTDRERRRWRWSEAAFLWKLALANPSRPLLLKSPSHTGRVKELVGLLGKDRVRFVHVAREPGAVLRSNVSMHRRLEGYALEDLPSEAETREYLIEDYAETMRALDEDFVASGASVSHIRFQDLVADPVGQLERAYDELGLDWTDEASSSVRGYLSRVGSYEARHGGSGGGGGGGGGEKGVAPDRDPRLEPIAARFDLDGDPAPSPTKAELVAPAPKPRRGLMTLGVLWVVCAAVWIGLAWLTQNRFDSVTWPIGLVLGLGTVHAAGVGSARLGLAAAGATVLLYASVIFPTTYLAYAHEWTGFEVESTRIAVMDLVRKPSVATFFFPVLGVATAYRAASRAHIRPPGR